MVFTIKRGLGASWTRSSVSKDDGEPAIYGGFERHKQESKRQSGKEFAFKMDGLQRHLLTV